MSGREQVSSCQEEVKPDLTGVVSEKPDPDQNWPWISSVGDKVEEWWEKAKALVSGWDKLTAGERKKIVSIVSVAIISAMLLSACEGQVSDPVVLTATASGVPALTVPPPTETLVPPLTVTPSLTPTGLPSPTSTLTPVPVVLCIDPVASLRSQGDKTQVLGNPLTDWQSGEQTKIVDALGNPIYPDVKAVAKGGADAGLVPIQVAVGDPQIHGGYVVVFQDNKGQYVYPQTQDASGNWVPANRMDGNGKITPNRWDVVPPPAWGQIVPWMQGETTGSCGYFAAVVENDQVAGRYDPITHSWVMDEGTKPTEVPMTILSMDVNHPTKMTEAQYWQAKFKPYQFSPQAKWLDNSTWNQDNLGFFGFYFYPGTYSDPNTRPLAVNGYAEVTRPDNSVWFVVQESVLTPSGNTVEWNFAWDEKNVAVPSTRITLDWLKKAASSGIYYFTPIGNKDGKLTTCREWESPPVCHQQDPNTAKMIEDLLATGVSDPKLSTQFLAASAETWNQNDELK